jgi:hypothetical protein
MLIKEYDTDINGVSKRCKKENIYDEGFRLLIEDGTIFIVYLSRGLLPVTAFSPFCGRFL